jgi:hypothetical protein
MRRLISIAVLIGCFLALDEFASGGRYTQAALDEVTIEGHNLGNQLGRLLVIVR